MDPIGAIIAWTKESPEFIAEFANISHKQINFGTSVNSYAGYAQIAWRLPFGERRLKPYYRYENISIPGDERVFRAIPELSGSTAGLRFDLTTFSALKLEYSAYQASVAVRNQCGFDADQFYVLRG